MIRPSVLLIGELRHSAKEWLALGAKYNLKEYREGKRDHFLQNCRSGQYDDVVALYRSNASTSITGRFDRELLSALPMSLKFVCHNGAGYDNIDVAAFTERTISISNTAGAVDNSTADITLFLMLGALRHATIPLLAVRDGRWKGGWNSLGHDPNGKVLGILGMGGIGRAVAQRARAFGMQIIYHNRSQLPEDLEGGARFVSFDTLLAVSDVLSLNLSLNDHTRHIISAKEFSKMKDGVVIINTARGALIKEVDLVTALETGKVGAAGLDVFENEPRVEEGLRKHDKIFMVPHLGTSTFETQREMELLTLRNLENAVDGQGLLTQIPEQKQI